MVDNSRTLSVTFALSLAFVTLAGPLATALDVGSQLWAVGVVLVSALLAYAALSYNPDLHVDGVWYFGFLVFLLSIGIHFLLGTGLTAGNATATQIVSVWLVSVCAVAVAFKMRVIEQFRV